MTENDSGPLVHASTDTRDTQTSSSLSLLVVTIGLLSGALLAFTNTYFGLKAAFITSNGLPVVLIGYALFQAYAQLTNRSLSPAEHGTLVSIATSFGTMPFTAGLVSIVPAIEYLIPADFGGPLRFPSTNLLVWSIEISIFGVTLALPLRDWAIFRSRLKFPWGTACATIIGVLHEDESTARKIQLSPGEYTRPTCSHSSSTFVTQSNPASSPRPDQSPWRHTAMKISISFAASIVYSLVAYFVPILNALPMTGRYAADTWLWSVSLSPAYISFGLLVDASISFFMLLGAVIGFGILSPLAKSKGWAPGPAGDWATGIKAGLSG